MKKQFATLQLLRRVFNAVSAGDGTSAALVRTFSDAGAQEKSVARAILLGVPVEKALSPLREDGVREIAIMASLLAGSSKSSTRLVGKRGESLSLVMEKWLKAADYRSMETRVMVTRAYIMSAVLGAVAAMLSSLGPMVANLNLLTTQSTTDYGGLGLAAAAMVATSSGMLGLFMSGRRFYVNSLIALAVFAAVSAAVTPLVAVQTTSLWAIK